LLALVPVAIGFLTVGLVSSRAADSQEVITFQCRLVQDGIAVSGTHTFTLRVYDAATGGNLLHTEVDTVYVSNGLVSTVLGDENGSNPKIVNAIRDADGDLFIAVETGGQDLLGSRVQLTAVPFSVGAVRAEGLWDPAGAGSLKTLSDLDTRYVINDTSGASNTITGNGSTANAVLILQSTSNVTSGTIILNDDVVLKGNLELQHVATPSTVTGGHTALYAKSDGKVYYKPSGGAETEIGSGGSTTTPASIVNGFRLTLESATPVSTADVTTSSVLYLTPYKSNEIWTKYGGTWTRHTSAEISYDLTLATTAADTNYDVFARWTGSSLELVLHDWHDDTTRASGSSGTDLAREDGIWVYKAAAGAVDSEKRYLGTVRTRTGQANSLVDTKHERFVWNVDNRVMRVSHYYANSSWTYNSTTADYWEDSSGLYDGDGNPAVLTTTVDLKHKMVIGIDDAPVYANGTITVNTYGGGYAAVAVGKDSTKPHSWSTNNSTYHTASTVTEATVLWNGHVGVGLHSVYPVVSCGAITGFGAGGFFATRSAR